MGVGRGYSGGAGVAHHRAGGGPSGHWLDVHGNPCKSPNDSYSPPPPPPPSPALMDWAKAPKLPNPDPFNYKVEEAQQVGNYLVLKVHYPDCTNFEGRKVMVFEGVTAIDLLKQRSLDPHFFNSDKVISPVARFKPTEAGWVMALRFAKMMEGESGG